MPNWCLNHLHVSGPTEDLKRFKAQAVGVPPWSSASQEEIEKPNPLNFHSLRPIPPEVLAMDYHDTGYNWEVANWGCKWGAVETELIEQRNGGLVYEFGSAWSPPVQLLTHLGPQWPELNFLLEYEEPGMGFQGVCKVHGDEVEDCCRNL